MSSPGAGVGRPIPLSSLQGALLLPVLAALVGASLGSPLHAQLRPLEAVDWKALEPGRSLSISLGAAVYGEQRASLAGVEGRLLELGSFRTTWRSGRVAIQAGGTFFRLFSDQTAFADPVGGAEGIRTEGRRSDMGDHRLSTLVSLDDAGGPWDGLLRFGVRLPTTDDRAGLERDRTDFFATVGVRHRRGILDLSGEGGFGVLGTHSAGNDQVDPLLFAARAELDLGAVRPGLSLTGQHDPRRRSEFRGNEDLGEARAFATVGNGWWLHVGVVRGWQTFSPGWGLVLETGMHW